MEHRLRPTRIGAARAGLGFLALVVAFTGPGAAPGRAGAAPKVYFREGFEDADLTGRGWYDGSRFTISQRSPAEGRGCLEYAWRAGGTTPATSGGVRRLFEPTDAVYLRCRLRLSEGWRWTERPFHPHLMHFLTTENGRFHGPALSRLTLYVEPWNGHLRLATQDRQNQDAPRGLTQGPLRGGYNGRMFDSPTPLFTTERWHLVEALFRLNTVPAGGEARADGVVQGWFDGRLVVDRRDVVFRSADFPRMRFNQFLLTPYFGPGLLPQAQTLWVDDLAVASGRLPG